MLKKIIILLFLLLNIPCISIAEGDSAGILVTPTRIQIDGRDRTSSVFIVNNGQKAGNYSVEIVNRRMDDDGKFSDVKDDKLDNELFADDLVRISPRRFRLEPKGYQNIRILVRKPADLKDGEYRSHLRLSIVPDDSDTQNMKVTNDGDENGDFSVAIKAKYSVNIPLIIRHGDLKADINISDMSVYKNANGKYEVSFIINRTGSRSAYGDITINDVNGELKKLGGISVYYPNNKRHLKILLDGDRNPVGSIQVIYKERDKNGLIAMAEKKL